MFQSTFFCIFRIRGVTLTGLLLHGTNCKEKGSSSPMMSVLYFQNFDTTINFYSPKSFKVSLMSKEFWRLNAKKNMDSTSHFPYVKIHCNSLVSVIDLQILNRFINSNTFRYKIILSFCFRNLLFNLDRKENLFFSSIKITNLLF